MQTNVTMTSETRDTLERLTGKLQQHRQRRAQFLAPAKTATIADTVACALALLERQLDSGIDPEKAVK